MQDGILTWKLLIIFNLTWLDTISMCLMEAQPGTTSNDFTFNDEESLFKISTSLKSVLQTQLTNFSCGFT